MTRWKNRGAVIPTAVIGLAALAVVGGAIKLVHDSSGSTPAALLGEVKREDLLQRVTVAGNVVPKKKSLITAPYNGYVRKIYVKVGDHVKPGDPIVSVAASLLNTGEEIYPLRAPIEGVVVQVLKAEGEYVEMGAANAMVRIDDLGHLMIESNSPENEIEKLKVGQEVLIKAQAVLGRSYKGRITRVSLAARDNGNSWDRSRAEFPVVTDVLDADEQLKPGMSVLLDIVAMKLEKVLVLRHEFIQKAGDSYKVTLANGETRPITVGARNEDGFEIKSGVTEGTKVRQIDFLEAVAGAK
jgi:multidrug efflux pump subunit AcrA (membrane-fusion protein)